MPKGVQKAAKVSELAVPGLQEAFEEWDPAGRDPRRGSLPVSTETLKRVPSWNCLQRVAPTPANGLVRSPLETAYNQTGKWIRGVEAGGSAHSAWRSSGR